MLDRDQLRNDMLAHPPKPGELVYVERRADRYAWHKIGATFDVAGVAPAADAWIYYSGEWRERDSPGWDAFFSDLLAELDSMAGGDDRCRWPLDDPWPHAH